MGLEKQELESSDEVSRGMQEEMRDQYSRHQVSHYCSDFQRIRNFMPRKYFSKFANHGQLIATDSKHLLYTQKELQSILVKNYQRPHATVSLLFCCEMQCKFVQSCCLTKLLHDSPKCKANLLLGFYFIICVQLFLRSLFMLHPGIQEYQER